MSRKLIFLLIWWVAIFLAIMWIIFVSWINKNKKNSDIVRAPDEFNIWVVSDETEWFDKIIEWFKQEYSEYLNTDIIFHRFAKYKDYEKSLLSVMADWNSPDIIVVPNSWWDILESKISYIPTEIISVDDFEKNFNPLFAELTVRTGKWKNAQRWIKWVPIWYEVPAILYSNIKFRYWYPKTWSEINNIIEKENRLWYSVLWLWLNNKKVPSASDILTAMFYQDKVRDYKHLSRWNNILNNYLSYYYQWDKDLKQFKDDLNEKYVTVYDLFIEWKIWSVVAYPSNLKDLSLAYKRSNDVKLKKKFVYSSPFPQIYDADWRRVTTANYYYFAMSRYSKNVEMWLKFLNYISTNKAQKTYLEYFTQYLPARIDLEDLRFKEQEWIINEDYKRVKFEDFIISDVELASFDKWLKTVYDSEMQNVIEDKEKTLEYLERKIICEYNHQVNNEWFDESCDL